MRAALPLLLVALLIAGACQDDEPARVAPAEQPSDTIENTPDTIPDNPDSVIQPPDTVVQPPDTVTVPDTIPPAARDSAYYRAGHHDKTPYRILLPAFFDSTKTYPLLIFLHGIGESGTDNEQQLKWGAPLFLEDSIRKKYPAIVVFPQCPQDVFWFDEPELQQLENLLHFLTTQYHIDNRRIYIGGLSMGAFGTYALVARKPDVFAAAVAISGDGDADQAKNMKKTKWRIFAGKKDEKVSYKKSEKMAKSLLAAGASVTYTLYPDADHDESWINAFEEPDFCQWIFSKSLEP